MKKTLRFSLLCCLLLAVILTASACLGTQTPEGTTPQTTTQNVTTPEGTTPEATTPEETTPETTTPETTTPEETTPEETTPEEIPDPDKPEGAVLVDSINGKSVRELLEKFTEDFGTATSYDFSMVHESFEDGVTVSESVAIKLTPDALVLNMNLESMIGDIYFVDGMVYINTDGQKLKMPAQSLDEVMGEGFFENFQNVPEFTDKDLEEVENAKIYLLDGIYIVNFLSTDEETGEPLPSRLEFNTDGELMLLEGTNDTQHLVFTVNSYGMPIDITPPADADEYILVGGTTPNPDIPEGAVAVDSLNGMNATQLYEKFLAEYMSSGTYDIQVNSRHELIGVGTMMMSTATKVNENAIYYSVEADGEIMEMWIIDGIAYINTNGEKLKYEGVAVEDLLGEGFLESILGSLIQDVPEEYYDALATTQLYRKDGVYFFTVTLSLPDVGIDSMTETVFFDENGKVISVIDSANGLYSQSLVKYGVPVEILPPADADEYVDGGAAGGDIVVEMPETEDEIYDLYSDMCTMLQDSDHFSVYIDIGGVYYVVYEIAGDNKHLMLGGEENVEQWLIDQAGYLSVDYEAILEVDVDAAFLESFTAFEEVFPIDAFAQEELQNLRCSYDEEWGEIVIEFEYASDSEHLSQCKYALAADASYVDITITEFVNGEEDVTSNFFFTIDSELEITLPEVG